MADDVPQDVSREQYTTLKRHVLSQLQREENAENAELLKKHYTDQPLKGTAWAQMNKFQQNLQENAQQQLREEGKLTDEQQLTQEQFADTMQQIHKEHYPEEKTSNAQWQNVKDKVVGDNVKQFKQTASQMRDTLKPYTDSLGKAVKPLVQGTGSLFKGIGMAGKHSSKWFGNKTQPIRDGGSSVVKGTAQTVVEGAKSAAGTAVRKGWTAFVPTEGYDWFVLGAFLIHMMDGLMFGWHYGQPILQFVHFLFILFFWMFVKGRERIHGNAGSIIAPILLGIAIFNGNAIYPWLIFITVTLIMELFSAKPNDLSLLLLFAGILWLDLFALSLIYTYLLPNNLFNSLVSSPIFIIKLFTNRILFPVLGLFTLFYSYTRRKSGFTATMVVALIIFWIFAAIPDIQGNFDASRIVTEEQRNQAQQIWTNVKETGSSFTPQVGRAWSCTWASIAMWRDPSKLYEGQKDDYSYEKCMRGMPNRPGNYTGDRVEGVNTVWVWTGSAWHDGEIDQVKQIKGDYLRDADKFTVRFGKPHSTTSNPLQSGKEYSLVMEFEIPDQGYTEPDPDVSLAAQCNLNANKAESFQTVHLNLVEEEDQEKPTLAEFADLKKNAKSGSVTVDCSYSEFDLAKENNELEFWMTLKGVKFRTVYPVLVTRSDHLQALEKTATTNKPTREEEWYDWYKSLYVTQEKTDDLFKKQFPYGRVIPQFIPSGLEFNLYPESFRYKPILGVPDASSTITFIIDLNRINDHLWSGVDDLDVVFTDLSFVVREEFEPTSNCMFSQCEPIRIQDQATGYKRCSVPDPKAISFKWVKDNNKLRCDMKLNEGSVAAFIGMDPGERVIPINPVDFEFEATADATLKKKVNLKRSSDQLEFAEEIDSLPVSSMTIDSLHDQGIYGITIDTEENTEVQAVHPGTVFEVGCRRAYGNFISVYNDEYALLEIYTHLNTLGTKDGVALKKSDQIVAGQSLGNVGRSEFCFTTKDCVNDKECQEDCLLLCKNVANHTITYPGLKPILVDDCVEMQCGVPNQLEKPKLTFLMYKYENRPDAERAERVQLNPYRSFMNKVKGVS